MRPTGSAMRDAPSDAQVSRGARHYVSRVFNFRFFNVSSGLTATPSTHRRNWATVTTCVVVGERTWTSSRASGAITSTHLISHQTHSESRRLVERFGHHLNGVADTCRSDEAHRAGPRRHGERVSHQSEQKANISQDILKKRAVERAGS